MNLDQIKTAFGLSGFQHLLKATGYSLKGLKTAWNDEVAFRQEILLALLFVPLALYLGETATEKALMIAVLGLVIITELLNSAIESVTDLASTAYHPLAGKAKDIASSAVMIALVVAGSTWLLILGS